MHGGAWMRSKAAPRPAATPTRQGTMGFLDWLLNVLAGGEPSQHPLAVAARRAERRTSPRRKLRASAAHDAERLAHNGLPDLSSRDGLAEAMGIRPMFGVTAFVCLALALFITRWLTDTRAD